MAANPTLTTLFSNGAAFELFTSQLSGTTGDDGKINFGVSDDGRFFIENRRGFGVGYALYIFKL